MKNEKGPTCPHLHFDESHELLHLRGRVNKFSTYGYNYVLYVVLYDADTSFYFLTQDMFHPPERVSGVILMLWHCRPSL